VQEAYGYEIEREESIECHALEAVKEIEYVDCCAKCIETVYHPLNRK
jgi:hypothetical protein